MSALKILALVACTTAAAAAATIGGSSIRITVSTGAEASELVQIRDGSAWVDALKTNGAVMLSGFERCTAESADVSGATMIVRGTCGNGWYTREIRIGAEPGTLAVTVRFVPNPGAAVASIEDRLAFAPQPRKNATPTLGPLDFVWSQNIKALEDEFVPHWGFKSPAIIFQQGKVFAAIVPDLDSLSADSLRATPVALDLDVTSGDRAWFSYGAAQNQPFGHSYFRRAPNKPLDTASGSITYQYWILASPQPPRLGYRRVTRFLWEKFGSPGLRHSLDLQRNVRKPELFLFDDWRREAWTRYANETYFEFDCNGTRCGSLKSNRNPWGKWQDAPKEDAWFNSWFQTLRTAYGWRLYAQRIHDPEMSRKAETILNLALTSPRQDGLFSTIYLHDNDTWRREEGWAGFPDSYHTFCMSWQGYWMLRWASDLVPARKTEILAYLKPYADFLVKNQRANGAIPSWFDERSVPRSEFRDFNAETAGSALFLAQFSEPAADSKYLKAAVRAQEFISREVIPRQRWYDFETFLSCARKPIYFYDPWTSQYPQNNLSTMQAAQALLKIYHLTREAKYLEEGQQVTDYLLLTQQVWNHPLFSPKLLGGTTTQNTDAEWSDARQCYLAMILFDYYQDTGRLDYLERSVAAARSGFAVAPWENWAHTGYPDRNGALTGFHWGTGSQMATVEMMTPVLGDAYINVARRHGVGFNASNVANVRVSGTTLSFDVEPRDRRLLLRFSGIDARATYKLIVNGRPPATVSGAELSTQGYRLEP